MNRLGALRQLLETEGLDGLIVPKQDEHLIREVAADAERLRWLTGFTGSAGTALVLRDQALLFVDGRYITQAAREVAEADWTLVHSIRTPLATWLGDTLPAGVRLGYAPRFHAIADAEALGRAAARAGATLVALDQSPIDRLWQDRPSVTPRPVRIHPIAFAGEPSEAKRHRLAADLGRQSADAAIVTALESIAWLFNIRGDDLADTPVARAAAILDAGGRATLFLADPAPSPALRDHLGAEVTIAALADFAGALDALGMAGRAVLVAAQGTNAWIKQRLETAGATIRLGADPCLLPRALKNPVELAGARAAHLRDGVALVRFLAWLKSGAGGPSLDEIGAQERLRAFRAEGAHFTGLSFPSISAAGPNAALMHYSAAPDTVLPLADHPLYLIDSGGQYLDGTTDVTRTVAIGMPDAAMRRAFTLVLKGHIALARARFPLGTSGAQLDVLARQPLWREGLDFDHGTGHGVGAYLCVHEGPQGISASNRERLQPGMILSNEPGYYEVGAFGMRFENLMAVREDGALAGSGTPLLAFETLTLAPIERALIAVERLDADEIAWIDAYHAEVAARLTPLLDPATAAWLAAECRPLAG
ncbi:aminopeptidase P family protein [Sphingomonas morindae]|uniref:Aminopeptidase P family protein n=1 Tax=Sphingomonas morindae TaxID=1541170 RepID=A0ABY4XAL3_9SPHN|nr:aminopeptidase P family protein [Sphingomonas morindae]USI73776.1 aminopeptidase P family protein [Sphingomonas morindae]